MVKFVVSVTWVSRRVMNRKTIHSDTTNDEEAIVWLENSKLFFVFRPIAKSFLPPVETVKLQARKV